MAFLLTCIGAIFFALKVIYNVRDVRAQKEKNLSPALALGGSFMAASIYLALLWVILFIFGVVHFPQSRIFWMSLGVTVVINVIFEMWRFTSYKTADLSLTAPFAGIAPVLTIVTSWIFLGELPTIFGGIGIGFIALCLYLLYLKPPFTWKNFTQPIRSIWEHPGVRLGFLSALPPALSIVFDKKAVLASDPISFSVLAFFFIGVSALLFGSVREKGKEFFSQLNQMHIQRFFKIGFFHFVSIAAFNSALLFDVLPHVSALRRLSIVFEVVFAYFLLDQKQDMKKRLLASFGVVLGITCIVLFQ